MKRRQFLGAVGLATAAGVATAQDHPDHAQGAAAHAALVHIASDCVSTGEVCLEHCHELLARGDKSMGACARSVSELTAVCGALRSLAAQNAPALAKVAAVALDVCNRCEAECRKLDKHPECKMCGDACAACAAECKKVV
jgi:Cys-rich four helix bundle protein (predicted Tat secretion target)